MRSHSLTPDPGGYLSDRLGTKRALLVFNAVAMAGFLIVIFIPTWQAVIVGAVFFLSWTAIEMMTAMLIYIPIAWLADRSGKKPFVVITFIFFTLFPLALLFCDSFFWLAGAFVLRGLKEFGEPTRKALIMDLAPEGKKAGMFGLYYLLRDVVVAVAAFGGAFLWLISPATNFLTAFACGVAGTLWFAVRGRDISPRMPQ